MSRNKALIALLCLMVASSCTRSRPVSLVLVTIVGWPSRPAQPVPPTPNLEAFVARADRSGELLLPSTGIAAVEASVQTGLLPARHGLRQARPFESLRAGSATLAGRARARGHEPRAFLATTEVGEQEGLALDYLHVDTPEAGQRLSRAARDVVAAAVEALDAAGPEQSLTWIQLDARDDRGGAGGLAEVDGALRGLFDAIRRRRAADRVVVAIVGTLGEELEAGLAADSSRYVHYAIDAGGDRVTEPCGAGITALGPTLARLTRLDELPCESVDATETFAPARRFGLAPLTASPPPTPTPLPELEPALVASLERFELPQPSRRPSLVRAGGGEPAAEREAVLDQQLAAIRLRHGHVASARALYERALEHDPLAVEALVETARLGAASGGSGVNEARLRRALPAYTSRVDIYHALAHLSFLAGKHEQALTCARVSVLFEPRDPDIAFDIAVNLAATGRRAEALDALERAIQLGFHSEKLLATLPHWSALRRDPRFEQLLAAVRSRR